MRDIKFRGVHNGVLLPPESLTQSPMYRQWLGKLDVELMQYTGLKDKNGKEIYEGDIVDVKYDTTVWGRKIKYDFLGQVKFGSFESEEREGCYDDIEGWYMLTTSDVSGQLKKDSLANHNRRCEIIGNIHENPELLGVKTEV